MLNLNTCLQIVGSKALWSLCLLLCVLPPQNKSCLVLSCLISLESDWGLHCSNKESVGLDQTGHMLMLICFCAKYWLSHASAFTY